MTPLVDGESAAKTSSGTQVHRGFEQALRYPLFSAVFHRRSRRISKGLPLLRAGHLSYQSDQQAQPLSALEEAMLIAVTGITGVTMPDMPFEAPNGERLLGSPMVELFGRAASSPITRSNALFPD